MTDWNLSRRRLACSKFYYFIITALLFSLLFPYYRFYTWYGWSHPPFWHEQTTTFAKTYVKGTITINLYDRRAKRLVWTGSAEGEKGPRIDLLPRCDPDRHVTFLSERFYVSVCFPDLIKVVGSVDDSLEFARFDQIFQYREIIRVQFR